MTSYNNVYLVIPTYKEEKSIGKVLDDVFSSGFKNVVVADCASPDKTRKIAEEKGAYVVRHAVKRGLGAGLRSGIQFAREEGAQYIITMDADGQHLLKDVKKVADELKKEHADVVIGSRLKDHKGMPWFRVFGNKVMNLCTWVLFGVRCSDTQSGLRGMNRNAAKKILIRTKGMEVSSEFIAEVKRKHLKLKEVPITAVYSEYSLQKGLKNTDAFKILFKLFLRKFIK